MNIQEMRVFGDITGMATANANGGAVKREVDRLLTSVDYKVKKGVHLLVDGVHINPCYDSGKGNAAERAGCYNTGEYEKSVIYIYAPTGIQNTVHKHISNCLEKANHAPNQHHILVVDTGNEFYKLIEAIEVIKNAE